VLPEKREPQHHMFLSLNTVPVDIPATLSRRCSKTNGPDQEGSAPRLLSAGLSSGIPYHFIHNLSVRHEVTYLFNRRSPALFLFDSKNAQRSPLISRG
jgi:hypothetical protein